jgi:hypothetical protein
MNNDITIFDCPNATLPFPQIDLFAPRYQNIFFQNPFFEKLIDDLGTKKTSATGDEYFFIGPECHRYVPTIDGSLNDKSIYLIFQNY